MEKKPTEVPDQHQVEQPGKEHKMTPEPEIIRDSYRGSDKLQGKIALITGGDSGIGRAVAVHFAREGADVAIVYLSEDQDAQDTKAMVEAEGRRCLLLPGDLREEQFCRQVVESTVRELGGLNILVNSWSKPSAPISFLFSWSARPPWPTCRRAMPSSILLPSPLSGVAAT
jgi:hypothetical protein